jgi:sortase (surface protein transpeptidase)
MTSSHATATSARHRARWSPWRAFGRPERTVAGVLVLVAAAGVGVDQLGAAPSSAGTGFGTALEERTDPGVVNAETAASAGLGLATAPQQPIALASDSPASGVLPTRLRIPSIGVDVATSTIGRAADGVLEPPEGLLDAGWFDGSAVPGAVGPAVIAGHVDDTEEAGVFARLHELTPGSEIFVGLSDGSERTFTVDGAADVAKTEFPTDAVYGPTRDPQLRLITCNGPYDFGVMHYSNNLVVFASAER